MKLRIFSLWERVRSSLWFVPVVMAAGAAGLAFAAVGLDRELSDRWVQEHPWAYTGGAEGAAAVLQTIAGSMITVAGVVFSLTLVALSLASSQFGPRLLRNFMRDRVNQVVLGTFVATFLYCLLVLRTVRREDESPFVPHLSVSLGVLMALVSLIVLIYFIHHVSVFIQANELVARVAKDLLEGIDRVFPEEVGRRGDAPESKTGSDLPAEFERESRAVPAGTDGYLQIVNADALMALASEADVIVRVERRPGAYVVTGGPLAYVWPGTRADPRLVSRIGAEFVLDRERTPAQDVEFPAHQLVEVAVRALSPGINDPFTAMTCVDRLGSALCRLAQRELPSPYRHDDEDRLRVIAFPVTFASMVEAAFDPIRQHGRASVAVTTRLLETIAVVAGRTHRDEDRVALRRQAEMILRGARDGIPDEEDRRAVEERHHAAIRELDTAT